MDKNKFRILYVFYDTLAAALSWSLFFVFRKVFIEPKKFGYAIPVEFDVKFYMGLFFIPVFWLSIYYFSGYYRNPFRKSRLIELGNTFFISLFGSVVLFFMIVLDDTIASHHQYYQLFTVLFGLQFMLTFLPRVTLSSVIIRNIHKGRVGFRTLLIGGNERAESIYLDLRGQKKLSGNLLVGYVKISDNPDLKMDKYLPCLGNLEDIAEIIPEKKIEEVLIALESSEHQLIGTIMHQLAVSDVIIKVVPSMYDIVTGKVKQSAIFSTPLIQISPETMPAWQESVKFFMDKASALFFLIVLSPISLIIAVSIKITSGGAVIYSHERVGRYGKPFHIYKFRTMIEGSEKNGPALSHKNDPRVTRLGKFLRQTKLDEIPNFFNVLKGEMSLIGPRPERKYFIDKIAEKAPHYIYLLKIKPGITSWGQVKFGYAENVDQMIERMKYDLIYLENMSLYVDLKILIYTILVIFKGKASA